MLSAVPRPFPAAILLLSLPLLLILALQGGQYFFGDEGRYDRGIPLDRTLAGGDFPAATAIAALPEHTLFPWIGALVTAAPTALAHPTPYGDWSPPEFAGFTIGLGAAVLSLFSTLNLFLLSRLALRAGPGAEEAAWAVLLMAAAHSAFCYSRHLLPSECALSAALAALGALLGGANDWSTLGAFSLSVTQGLFAEGWSLPWEDFWPAEGLLGAGLALAVALGLFSALRTGVPLPDRVRVTLLTLVAASALLVAASCRFARLVVSARTLQPLVPPLCLLGRWALARLVAPRPIFKPCLPAALILAAALPFAPHFTRVFPRETDLALLRARGNPMRVLTVTGSVSTPLSLPVSRPDLAFVNAQALHPGARCSPPPWAPPSCASTTPWPIRHFNPRAIRLMNAPSSAPPLAHCA